MIVNMKKKEFQEYKNKTVPELRRSLNAFVVELGQLRFDLAGGKVKNIREIRKIKKDVARLLTIIRQKENN